MRTIRRATLLASPLVAACVLAAAPSQAREETPSAEAPSTAPTTPAPTTPASSTPASSSPKLEERPAPPDEEPPARSEGLRVGLDLAFGRGAHGGAEAANAGSPSLIPLGVDVSWHVSSRVLLGGHGHVALASRDDCPKSQDCTARDYALGPHVEVTLSKNGSMVPWFRYGAGWELLYRGGIANATNGYAYRHALNVVDARLGIDFVAARGREGRSTRIGPYVGFVGGLLLAHAGSLTINGTPYDFDRGGGDASYWFLIGLRGTTDL